MLIVSIWMLVILSVFSVSLYGSAVSGMAVSRRLRDFSLSYHAARGVCRYVKHELDGDHTKYDTLFELAQSREKKLGLTRVVYTFIDEESKININILSADMLKRLPGINEDIARDITTSPFRPFSVKEELLLVNGVDENAFTQFSDFITVHSSGRVNINTASPQVLRSLGLENSLVDIIMSFRKGIDGEAGTEDDGVFETKEEILDTLRSFTGLFEAQEQQLLEYMGWFDVEGEFFLVNIETEVRGRRARRYNIIMNSDKIIQWREM